MNNFNNIKQAKKPVIQYVILFITVFILFVIFRQNTFHDYEANSAILNLFEESTIKGFMTMSLLGLLAYSVYEGFNGRLTPQK